MLLENENLDKEAAQNFCLERATIASGKARVKTKILMQSRRRQNFHFLVEPVYISITEVFKVIELLQPIHEDDRRKDILVQAEALQKSQSQVLGNI